MTEVIWCDGSAVFESTDRLNGSDDTGSCGNECNSIVHVIQKEHSSWKRSNYDFFGIFSPNLPAP